MMFNELTPEEENVIVNKGTEASFSGNAVFGAGCFWCAEAVFSRLKGVKSVIAGYAGGTIENPTYEQVSTGKTGYVEVVKIEYDKDIISYENLLDVFFHTHNPTSKNKQGNDEGEQYQSVIFFTTEDQKKQAEEFIKKTEEEKEFSKPIVTEVKLFINFYKAEDYHQDYYKKNPEKAYCQVVISPKIKEFYERYGNLIDK